MARAAWEGIAWRTAEIVEAIGAFQEVDGLRVDGGLTREPLLARLQADTIGRPVRVQHADSTAIGAGGLAAVGSGHLASVEAIAALVEPGAAFEPSIAEDERLGQLARWRSFVEAAGSLPA